MLCSALEKKARARRLELGIIKIYSRFWGLGSRKKNPLSDDLRNLEFLFLFEQVTLGERPIRNASFATGAKYSVPFILTHTLAQLLNKQQWSL